MRFNEFSTHNPTTTFDDAADYSDSVIVQEGALPKEMPGDTLPRNSTAKDSSNEELQETNTIVPPVLRRSSRIRKQPGEWWKETGHFVQALSAQIVPTLYRAPVSPENRDFWKPRIDREHDRITRNKTWSLIERKQGMHVLRCKYVFKIKEGKPKVRLVAMGCKQIHGVDYNEIFAPVGDLTTIRTILALASYHDLELEQMDVVTAFLNGDLNEDIYMAVPEGFRNPTNSNLVCKLQKSLYGLKQSPRHWYAKKH